MIKWESVFVSLGLVVKLVFEKKWFYEWNNWVENVVGEKKKKKKKKKLKVWFVNVILYFLFICGLFK